jgi:hypothetical protein
MVGKKTAKVHLIGKRPFKWKKTIYISRKRPFK